jgi:hypothetical protein
MTNDAHALLHRLKDFITTEEKKAALDSLSLLKALVLFVEKEVHLIGADIEAHIEKILDKIRGSK